MLQKSLSQPQLKGMKGTKMDENTLESEEIEKASKKAYIAEIKLDKIMEEAKNCRHRPPEIVDLT